MRINIDLHTCIKMAKKSAIWNFFTVAEDTRYAVCNECKTSVARGGKNTKAFNTTNVLYHLQTKHTEVYSLYERQKAAKESQKDKIETPTSYQMSLISSFQSCRVWDINDSRSVRIHQKIGEFIAVDCQPLSVVRDVGFVRLLKSLESRYSIPSRKYFTNTVLPKIYEGVKAEVVKEVDKAVWLSFTTDIWSTDISNESLLSLTTCWLSESFEKRLLFCVLRNCLNHILGSMFCLNANTHLVTGKLQMIEYM